MKKHEIIYQSYKRYHKGEQCLELEEKKIHKEQMMAKKKMKQASKKLDKLMNYENINDEYIEELDNLLYAEKKVRKNRKTHKKRLSELKKNKDFK
ncbi:hypothetical protein PV797_16860 [Clostridiaceae bacterium M8S5]|nr:hypothetical protein PV797_16860 [Clostridiaceae bacterium M8S5]